MNRQPLNPSTAGRLVRLYQLNSGDSPASSGQYLTFSADGRWLVSMSHWNRGRLRWWNLDEARSAPEVDIPLEGGSSAVVVSGTGTVLSATHGGSLQEWSVHTGGLVRQVRLDTGVSGLALSADEKNLLVVGGDGHSLVWDVTQWEPKRVLEKRTSRLYGGALSPDGRLAAAGAGHVGQTASGSILVWDVSTGAVVSQVPVEAFWAWCVAFHPSLPLLVAGAPTHDIYVVDALEWKVIRRLESLGTQNVNFSPSGELLVAGGTGFSALCLPSGATVHDHHDDNDEQASSAVLSPDGTLIAWGEGDGNVGLFGVPG